MASRFRHELKFFIHPHQYHAMRQRLRYLLRLDPHAGPTGDYRVTSLYFDDATDSALYEKLSGVQHRQKIRVRTYNGQVDLLMLEKKVKVGAGVLKERLRIDQETYQALLSGHAEPLRDASQPLLQEVAWQMTNRLLRPKVIVDYVREAYLHPAGNVRITFDKDLRSGLTSLDLLRQAPLVQAPTDGMTILEVKYDNFLPRPVQDLLQTDGLVRQSASKSVLCRTLSRTQAWEDQ